ncbi:MAG: hypothetical protein V1779_17080 [bacterium]
MGKIWTIRMTARIIAFTIIMFFAIKAYASESKTGDLSIGSLSYLSYQTEITDADGLQGGAFKINRSYLTVKKSLYKNLGFRMTLDATQDETGDMKVRLKYVYANYLFDDLAFVTKPNIEFGQVHTPWLDYEEHVNYYRMQGTMFMERSELFNSSDFGITAAGYLGGELDDNYKKTVNSKYAGRYGSFAFGVYNGGGYHAKELTQNKTFEARLTLRPLPDIIPGFQVSYFGVFGKGNTTYGTDTIPNWNLNAALLSYEHQYFTLTGQFVMGEGNQKGKFVDDNFNGTNVSGYSVFAEGKIDENWRVIARYDDFDKDIDIDNNKESRIIAGVGYDFGHENILILDFDKTMYEDETILDKNMIKLTMQINF